jgi:hypothetical protein
MKLMGCHLESKDSKIRQKQVQLSGSCESTWNLAQPPIGRPTSRLDKFRSHGAAFEKEPSQDYMLPSPLVVNQSSPQLPPHSCIPQLAPVQRQTRHDSLQSSAEPTLSSCSPTDSFLFVVEVLARSFVTQRQVFADGRLSRGAPVIKTVCVASRTVATDALVL